MNAEERAVACMKELRRQRDGTEPLRCPPHTTEEDMYQASAALSWIWYGEHLPKPALIKPKTFDRLYLAFWATYVLACAGVLGWVIYGVCHRAAS